MGFIRDQIGRFSIESRRESFYIHADYGYKPLEKKLSDVELGGFFYYKSHPKNVYQVLGKRLSATSAANEIAVEFGKDGDPAGLEDGELIVIPCEAGGDPVDLMEDGHPLGLLWIAHPHPEIDNEDLDDLIRALTDYAESRGET